MEDFSLSPTPVNLNKDDILDDKMPCVLGVWSYTFELRSVVSGVDGDGES